MKNNDSSSSCCNNRRRQSSKRFCKHFSHNIETCYHRNKSSITNVIRMVGNASYSSSLSALSGMSPFSWLMDSACCNHMTPNSSLFSELKPVPHPLNIRTANGSTMSSHNIGFVSTSNLSVPRVFNVPDLSYNLFSVGQLAELGYNIIFDYSGYIV